MIFYADNGSDQTKFYNYTQLINWLSKFNYRYPTGHNSFLAYTSPTGTDIGREIFYPDNDSLYFYRDHRVTQQDGISIYCKRLIKEVRAWRFVESIEQERLDRLAQEEDPPRKSRRNVSSRYYHHGHYNGGASKRDLQAAADPEHAPYIRASRNLRNLPPTWDDTWHRRSSNWKNQNKCRHQWEHKIINTSRHLYKSNIYV